MHSEVIEQFDSFSLLKLLFLLRNWHCWSRKAFPRQMTPEAEKKTANTAVFRHRWQAWKVVRSIAAVRWRPMTPRDWWCSFAFFESFLWHFNEKQHAEVIFRFSRPVSCKNQKNGAGKQWCLHAPLKLSSEIRLLRLVFFNVWRNEKINNWSTKLMSFFKAWTWREFSILPMTPLLDIRALFDGFRLRWTMHAVDNTKTVSKLFRFRLPSRPDHQDDRVEAWIAFQLNALWKMHRATSYSTG